MSDLPLGHTSKPNNLSLALEPIWHIPDTQCSCMTLMLAPSKRLSEWIRDILICWYSAYLHISSVYDFSYEMEAPQYMFGSLVRPGFLSLRNGSIVVTIENHWV